MRLSSTCVLLSLAVAGCAAAGPADLNDAATRAPTRINTRVGTFNATSYRENSTVALQVQAPVEEVWTALAAVYQELGLPVDAIDKSRWIMGTQGARLRRDLAGTALSTYLDCGVSLGTVNANMHQVTLGLLAQLHPVGETGTEVRVQVDAVAEPLSVSSAPVQCASLGRLEQEIVERIGRKL